MGTHALMSFLKELSSLKTLLQSRAMTSLLR